MSAFGGTYGLGCLVLVDTKLHLPGARRQFVERVRLTEQLMGATPATSVTTSATSMPRLVLVAAPAGFGKTTLLTQWLNDAQNRSCRVACVSLDGQDSDARRFLTHVVTALHRSAGAGVNGVSSGASTEPVGGTALRLLEAEGPLATEEILGNLVNDLSASDDLTVLALDDYHLIEATEVHQAVTFLLDRLPARATVAITTRVDPPLPVARLRSRGELLELRAADLRFTLQEAEEFLNEVMGLNLESAHVAALDARTEGWAAGLQLAALSMRRQPDTDAFIAAFTGSHRFILDYLVEEVLASQPDRVSDFLLDTCLLRQLTAPLCDAVTGRDDGHQTLTALDRDNLFLIPLDDHRTWYRYHHLFADALQARLRAQRPEQIPELHRAASRWHAAHGELADAFAHAVAGDHFEDAADLVERALPDLRRRRQDRTLRARLRALPDDVVRRRPLLCTAMAWTWLSEGDFDAMTQWLDAAEAGLANPPPGTQAALGAALGAAPEEARSPAARGFSPDEMRDLEAELRSLPAAIAMYRASAAQARGDIGATIEHARRSMQLAGPDDHFVRGGAAGFLGLATWASGDLLTAIETFTEAVQHLRAAGNVTDEVGTTVVLAEMWLGRGGPLAARRLYERALAVAERHPGPVLASTGDLHVGLADVLRESGDLDAAEEHLQVANDLGEGASLPENAHRWFVAKAHLLRSRGDLDGAAELLEHAKPMFQPGYFPDLHPIPAAKARVRIAQGRLDEAWEWADQHGVTVEDPAAYVAEYEQLTLARLLLAHERVNGPAARPDEVVGLLDRVVKDARSAGRSGSLIEALLIRALVHHARGDLDRALADIKCALRDGVPVGYRHLFLDEGPHLVDLLHRAACTAEGGELAATLLHGEAAHTANASPESDDAATGGSEPPGTEGLSSRELEVLRALATDRTGPEIAAELFVSVNTLRTHTKHIFTKLGVTTRQAAVLRATALGLL
jgi:LuxR family transcriptional regulator, maltose regulon positive regulatory protein